MRFSIRSRRQPPALCWQGVLGLLLALVLCCPASPGLAASATGFVPDPPSTQVNGNKEYGRFLVLRPAEYSRYEISPDGHVVVFFPLGVEGWYMGYYLKAGQLRYDQATEVASLSGGVLFKMPGYSIGCASLELDGRLGQGSIPGTLSGYYEERGLYFQAGSAALSFPAGSIGQRDPLELRRISLLLAGRVRATDKRHNTLITDSLRLDGPAGTVSSGSEFDLLVSSPESDERAGRRAAHPMPSSGAASPGLPKGPADWADIRLYPLLIHGSSLQANVDEEKGLTGLTVSQPLLRTEQWLLSADTAVLDLPALRGLGTTTGAAARVSGSPVQLVLTQGLERRVSLRAGSISLLSLGEGSQTWLLEDNATLDSPEGRLSADSISLKSSRDSYSVELPDGIDLDFNFSELSGSSLLEAGAGRGD